MLLIRSRLAVLAVALILPAAHADESGLRLQRSLVGPPKASGAQPLPTFLSADRVEGITGKESTAEGDAELRKGDTSIQADTLKYYEENEDVDARGNVRLQRAGDVLTGPSLKYRVKDATGVFESPDYSLAPRVRPGGLAVPGRGHAAAIEFAGEDKYTLKQGTFTTCKPGDDAWIASARQMDLDYTRQVGVARDARVEFKGVPILKTPYLSFSLNNQRKSGFLPPTFGSSGKTGPELSVPYYLNLAPNYDLTLMPRYMEKRGLQLGGDFRYLQPAYRGTLAAEILPNDKASQLTRSAVSLTHTYQSGPLGAGLNINRVSDDNYYRDLSTRINLTSQAYLLRDGYLSYGGPWWGTGGYGVTARVQGFQTLQDPLNPIPNPYERRPQLTLGASRADFHGLDVNVAGEYVDFTHPTNVTARRAIFYPSVTLPLVGPGAYLTPKLGYHMTHYDLSNTTPDMQDKLRRTLPVFSLDSGLAFEREARIGGQALTQTLEPRAYYVRVPYRNQNAIPLFDTGISDFNYAQIFSENSFGGGDRFNDANQLTLAVSSRLLSPSTGQEAVRATIGQRFYFKEQQVTLNPTDTPRTFRHSDWLATLSGRVAPKWIGDAGVEYNPRDNRYERLTLSARYQPEPLKTLNISYRYLRDQIDQLDVSAQWPLGAGWFGVGRFNYSVRDRRVVENLGGFEYQRDCWIGRVVIQRFALTANAATTAMFFQLELNGFSRIGSNPLETLKRNIPGYQRLNESLPESRPEAPFNFYN